ncbi:MAG: alpha/beta hydrolase [Bacteroidales bacterium]|nr:alpha/beta hydrolase [Bacteroidales bacterium]
MESKILKTDVGTIEYTLAGEGKTILIVHGGNDNCFSDVKQQHLIDDGYQILIPSRPGYSHTSIEFGKTASEQADFLKILLDSLNIKEVAVLANSAGGAVGLEFAKKYSENTACLILEEAITKTWVPKYSVQYYGMKYLLNPKRQEKLWEKQREEFKNTRDKHLKRICKMFSTLKPEYVLRDWDEKDIGFYGDMLSHLNSGNGFVHNIDHKAKDIHLITVPTLITHSPFDKNVPFSHALYAHKNIKNSQLYIAPAVSHIIYMGKNSEYILDKRISFLKEIGW